MGVISQNGIDYPVPSVPVQSDGSATDLTNASVPTGQTIKSYLNSNFSDKVRTSSARTDANGYATFSYPTGMDATNCVIFALTVLGVSSNRRENIVPSDVTYYNAGVTVGGLITERTHTAWFIKV